MRARSTFTVVCDHCEDSFQSVADWLDHLVDGKAYCKGHSRNDSRTEGDG